MTCNELNSDVACSITHESNLFCNKSGQCCRLRKVVAESRIVVLLLTTKSLYVARFTDPRQTCFALSPHVWRDSRVILSNQKSVFTQVATSLFVARQV